MRLYRRGVRTVVLGIFALCALIWGAVSIVGASSWVLAEYLFFSVLSMAFVAVVAVPIGLLLGRRRRP